MFFNLSLRRIPPVVAEVSTAAPPEAVNYWRNTRYNSGDTSSKQWICSKPDNEFQVCAKSRFGTCVPCNTNAINFKRNPVKMFIFRSIKRKICSYQKRKLVKKIYFNFKYIFFPLNQNKFLSIFKISILSAENMTKHPGWYCFDQDIVIV